MDKSTHCDSDGGRSRKLLEKVKCRHGRSNRIVRDADNFPTNIPAQGTYNVQKRGQHGSRAHELAVVLGRHVRVAIQRSGWVHVGDIDRPLISYRIHKHVEVEGQIHSQVLQEETGLVNELSIVLSRKRRHDVGFESIPEKVNL
jgi:hypothetical protein